MKMKKLIWAIPLVLLSLPGRSEYATVDVHVFDADSGEPLPDVKVCGEFQDFRDKTNRRGRYWEKKFESVTDSNGCCRVRGETDSGCAKVCLGPSPKGYYPVGSDIDYETTGEKDGDDWLPKVLSQEVPVSKKGSRVPMIAKIARIIKKKDGQFVPLSENGEKGSVAYDMFECDLLPPYGKGKVADLVFTCERETTGVEDHDPRDPKAKRLEFYTWHHTLSVPGKGNGIRAFRRNPFSLICFRNATDEGLVESVTRKIGLEKYIDEDGWYPVPFGEEPDRYATYSLRLRSEFDESGRRAKAYYAKIEGEFEVYPYGTNGVGGVKFLYYLNPKANDRNVEWNCKDDLPPGTPR